MARPLLFAETIISFLRRLASILHQIISPHTTSVFDLSILNVLSGVIDRQWNFRS